MNLFPEIQNQGYADDHDFLNSYKGANIVITGATGTIGMMILDTIMKKCYPNNMPNKIALFVRDETNLPTNI